MNLKLKLFHAETGILYSCGTHGRGMPDYCGWDSIRMPATIGDEDVLLHVWGSKFWKTRINFEYRDKAYYFDDAAVATHIRNHYHRYATITLALNFEPRWSETKPRVEKYVESLALFGGRTVDLVSDSKIKNRETNDCTVMALMECMQIKYDKAHAMLKPYRRERKGIPFRLVLDMHFKDKFEEVKLPRKMTLGTFVKEHTRRSERYIVIVNGHALCVAEGKIYDHTIKVGRKVKSVYVLK